MVLKSIEKKARAYALKNALAYNGKAQQGAVIAGLFHEGLKKTEVGKYAEKISEIVKDVNSLSLKEQEKEFEPLSKFISERPAREGLPELPDVKKSGVVMRFAPSASGPMHIGHALTSCLSFLYVKKYGGRFYLRIEDTDPENIYPLAYKMLEEEARWLFNSQIEVGIQSDRMSHYYDYSEKLIKNRAAYICTCDQEKFKKNISAKRECPCRKLSVEENIKRWRKMKGDDDGFKEGEAVLRFKTPESEGGMKNPNPAMRDFPLARINLSKHPRQGKKYRVWPLMNLAVAVDDIEMNMTHIIRGKDHMDNAKRQKMIYLSLGVVKKFPWTGFLGKVKFKDLELSTTKMREAIEKGEYDGWDDKRLPTIASLMKRGYKPQAFWKFSEMVGLSETDKVMDKKEYFTLLDSFNK